MYCVAFVGNIIDRLLLVNSAVAVTTHFLYSALIDTQLVILGFDVMRRFVVLASRLSD